MTYSRPVKHLYEAFYKNSLLFKLLFFFVKTLHLRCLTLFWIHLGKMVLFSRITQYYLGTCRFVPIRSQLVRTFLSPTIIDWKKFEKFGQKVSFHNNTCQVSRICVKVDTTLERLASVSIIKVVVVTSLQRLKMVSLI